MTSLPGQFFLRNLVERRSLLWELVERDFKKRFVGSVMGWLWGVIHPLVLLLSWTFVFSVCLKMKITENYPLFLFAGMLPWLLFSETVQRSATSLVENTNLITKTVFPVEVIPISVFLSTLLSHLLSLALSLVAAAVILERLSPLILLLPAYMLLIGLFAVGVGWVVSSLQVYLRDTAQVLTVGLTFWFWLTPIFINEDQFPARFRFLLQANPMAFAVRAYRAILLTGTAPALDDFLMLALYSSVVFVAGGLFFRRMRQGFADVL